MITLRTGEVGPCPGPELVVIVSPASLDRVRPLLVRQDSPLECDVACRLTFRWLRCRTDESNTSKPRPFGSSTPEELSPRTGNSNPSPSAPYGPVYQRPAQETG